MCYYRKLSVLFYFKRREGRKGKEVGKEGKRQGRGEGRKGRVEREERKG